MKILPDPVLIVSRCRARGRSIHQEEYSGRGVARIRTTPFSYLIKSDSRFVCIYKPIYCLLLGFSKTVVSRSLYQTHSDSRLVLSSDFVPSFNMLFKLLPVVTLILAAKEVLAVVKFKGVNIAGFDFGCYTNVIFFPQGLFFELTRLGHLYSSRHKTSFIEPWEVGVTKGPKV